ncbi:unnamed protein product [Parajaminaea phylloscopi]
MRFLPRDTESLTGLATSLSLVIANYKPVPQLPTAEAANSTSKGNSLNAHRFKTASANYTNPYADASLWGVPSTLYIDDTSDSTAKSANGHQLASGTVGPGGCPLNTGSYSPKTTLGDPTYAKFDSVKSNMMRYRQQISANLGAWFVQEGWMQSSFMSCARGDRSSEHALLSGFGTSANGLKSAQYYLEQHWDTWITEDDFKFLASKGFNTVRIPIGYWSVGPYFAKKNSDFAPYANVYQNSWKYVARAIRWAAKYDLGVLLDLHGAYGSQNGNDHSGISGSVNFFTSENRQLTADLLKWLANEVAPVTNIVGLQVLNEPQNRNVLWTWYSSTMDDIRTINNFTSTLPLYFHDAFNMPKGSDFVSKRKDFVVQDNHSYFVYTSADTSMSAQAHTSQIQGQLLSKFQQNSNLARRNMIVGEWSCALAPSSLSGVSDKTAATRKYCMAQQDTYANATAGYHYWSYKMENCDSNAGWCLKAALGKYLPSYLNTWGFSGYVTNRKILLNLESSRKVSASIISSVSSLSPNSASSSTAQSAVARVAAVSVAGSGSSASSPDYSNGVALADTGVNIAPLLDTNAGSSSSSGSAGGKTYNRIGMVTGTTSSSESDDGADESDSDAARRRGTGSLAARAAEIQRRAAAKVLAAQEAGFSDGYLTSTYFASAMSTSTPLSRLGFSEQYMMDSWNLRVSWGRNYTSENWGHYRTHFLSGASQAESAIVGAVNSAQIPASS